MKQIEIKKNVLGVCLCLIVVVGVWLTKSEEGIVLENTKVESDKGNIVSGNDKIVEKDIVLTVESNADFQEEYGTVEELCAVSDEIVKAKVVSSEAFCDDTGTVFTRYRICVKDVIYGELRDANEVEVVDFGGTIDAEEYFRKQTDPKALEIISSFDSLENKVVEYDFEGAWRPLVDEEYIWYLEKKEEGDKIYYSPVNCYQGVFEIQNNDVERYSSDDDSKEYISEITENEMYKIVNEVTDYESK